MNKALQLGSILSAFEMLGMDIEPSFYEHESIEAPVLLHVKLLLEASIEKGIKLTPKGNLPTALVEKIATTMPTGREKEYLSVTRRFIEEEHKSAMRARALADVGGLIDIKKTKIAITPKGEAWLQASAPEQYLVLLHSSAQTNLAYYDYHQELDVINALQLSILQFMRDKEALYRKTEVYVALMLEYFPNVYEHLEDNIQPDPFLSDIVDVFEKLVELRLFSSFLAPFGLIQERGNGILEGAYECIKTPLLDAMLEPKEMIDAALVLDKKLLGTFAKEVREQKLQVDLFQDIVYLLGKCMVVSNLDSKAFAKEMVEQKRFLGTAATTHQAFYEKLSASVVETLLQFTQLEGKGARPEIQDMFESLVDGLVKLLPQSTPYHLFQAANVMPESLLSQLHNHYNIEPNADIAQTLEKTFNKEVAEDVATLFYHINALAKATKKAKRISIKVSEPARVCVIAYLMAVMSIYVYEVESD